MKKFVFVISTLFFTTCQSAESPIILLTEGQDYFVSSAYNPEEKTIVVSVKAGSNSVCINPDDWPLAGGKISSLDNPLTIHRGDQMFTFEEVYLDGGMGVTIKVDPYQVVSTSVPLDSFYGITEWTGHEEIHYSPRVSTCY
jgi:hypothetical protein